MIVAIVMFVCFFATVFGIVYLRTRENMALIERGMNPRINYPKKKTTSSITLKLGLLLIGAGTGLLLAYIIEIQAIKFADRGPAIYFALISIGGGIGLLISYFIEKKELKEKKNDILQSNYSIEMEKDTIV